MRSISAFRKGLKSIGFSLHAGKDIEAGFNIRKIGGDIWYFVYSYDWAKGVVIVRSQNSVTLEDDIEEIQVKACIFRLLEVG
jgi:hypothetical protein